MKKIAFFLPLMLLFAGCTAQEPAAENIREHFDTLAGFAAHVKIFSDFGNSALEYELDYAYNREGSDHLVLTAPEPVAGIEATIDGEESFLLRYGGAELENGMPPVRGVTPADGVYWLLRELRESEPLVLWGEPVYGTPALVLRYEGETDGVTVMRQVWLTKDGLQPLCAEVYADGTRALLITFSDYREGAALPEPISEQPAEPGAEAAPEQAGPPAE